MPSPALPVLSVAVTSITDDGTKLSPARLLPAKCVPHSGVMDDYEEIDTSLTILPGVALTLWSVVAFLLVVALAVATVGLTLG
jgi:hypothetical protein